MKKLVNYCAIVGLGWLIVGSAQAADVTLTADDAFGTSSLDSAENWSNNLTPSAGNDYFTSEYTLRTPSFQLDYVFGGDSLTVNNTNGYPHGLLFKGLGGSNMITIDNLILDGGIVSHANGVGDTFNLAGRITVVSDSQIYAKQGVINIIADISGTATITNPGSDGAGRTLRFLSATSDFEGDFVNDGSFELASGAVFTFVIGSSGVSNSISGSGSATYNGAFEIDLSGASANPGDSWLLANVSTQSFGATFSVLGFVEEAAGIWTSGDYWFSEGTGVLSVGEPPLPATVFPLAVLTNTAAVPNGAWSWFEDERCIVDANAPGGPRLLVSSVSSAADGDDESGDIDVTWLNMLDESTGHFELKNRFQRDDHDSAALWVRPDGRYLAVFAGHTSDPYTRWRISTNPHDPSAWETEQTFYHSNNTTYSNVHFLPGDNGGAGRLYNFSRILNWDPSVMTSDDHGSTWSGTGKLITMGGGSDRPYVRYFSNGDRIHFITTEEHPRDYDNSVYHGYVKDGVSYDSDGNVIDSDIFDSSGPLPTAFTPVFLTGTVFGATTMRRAWTIDVAIDGDDPVVLFIARARGSTVDHRFFYGRYSAGSGWTVYEIAHAGGYLYAAEDDYTGLASIDPDDPNVIVLSSDIDPRDGSATARYELYRGRTSDGGATWTWIPLTENSTEDNLRPLVPSFTDGFERVMVWMRGTYTTYTSWDTQAVVMREVVPERIAWGCVSGPDTTVVPAGCPPVQFVSLDRDGDGDVDLDDLQPFQDEAQILSE